MKKLLIIDDIEINRILLEDMLCSDFEMIQASGGKEAVSLIESGEAPDAVLLDCVMPDMSGTEFLEIMSGKGFTERVPVVLMTAEPDEALLEKAFSLGAVDMIEKPFNYTVIRKRLSNLIALFELSAEKAAV